MQSERYAALTDPRHETYEFLSSGHKGSSLHSGSKIKLVILNNNRAVYMSEVVLKNDGTLDITVVKNIRDYSKDPLVSKKAEKALAFIRKHGLPKAKKEKKK